MSNTIYALAGISAISGDCASAGKLRVLPLEIGPESAYLHNVSNIEPIMSVTDQTLVTVSNRAAAKIAAILTKEPAGSMLRVAVEGGGCSGFQYKFDIVKAREDDDVVLDADGFSVLIDSVSVDYMAGSEIDFSDELIGAAFKINNPNATASCGCGTSFSL